jgi:hypothetical protein
MYFTLIYLVKMFILCSEFSAESMQGYDTSLIYLNWIQVYQLAIDTILFYDIQVNKIVLLLLTYLSLDADFINWQLIPYCFYDIQVNTIILLSHTYLHIVSVDCCFSTYVGATMFLINFNQQIHYFISH